MTTLIQKIKDIDWAEITENMHQNGYAVIPGLLEDEECERLKADYEKAGLYRKRVIMKRYRFGLGEYKYYDYPLPDIIQNIRTHVYPHLAPIANTWFRALQIDKQFSKS